MSIPQVQQAAVVENPGDNFTVVLRDNVPVGDPGTDEILIKLNYTGIW